MTEPGPTKTGAFCHSVLTSINLIHECMRRKWTMRWVKFKVQHERLEQQKSSPMLHDNYLHKSTEPSLQHQTRRGWGWVGGERSGKICHPGFSQVCSWPCLLRHICQKACMCAHQCARKQHVLHGTWALVSLKAENTKELQNMPMFVCLQSCMVGYSSCIQETPTNNTHRSHIRPRCFQSCMFGWVKGEQKAWC